MRRPPGVRIFWLLCAALQLALPGLVSLADAELQAETLPQADIAQIASPSTTAPGHGDPQDCPFCQFLSHPLDVSRPAVFAPDVRDQRAPFVTSWVPKAPARRLRLPDSRAPPALS